MKEAYKLDNPVWYSLTEYHQKLALIYNTTQFYNPEYCAFGAFDTDLNNPADLHDYSEKVPSFFIFGAKPKLPDSLVFKSELLCLQMIVDRPIEVNYTEEIIQLNDSHQELILDLVKIVYPEYFKPKTATLGNYYGIFKNSQLVAITGERMQMEHFTEVSAVITHPEHTGKSYAKQLVAHTANAILEQNKTPFLHVSEANHTAIGLYEKLGFTIRTKISIWQIARK